MNRKKGAFRLAILISILIVALGVLVIALSRDEDIGVGICIFGPVFVWFIYFGFWFVLKGFDRRCVRIARKTLES